MLFLRIILFPLTPLYRWAICLRNYLFDRGIYKSQRVDAKVISIGNITVGGSGKTPAVILTTDILKKAGRKVGVLSRGYGRNSKGYRLVSEGSNIQTEVRACGDEIYLTAMECSVPAAVSEKRVEGARQMLRDTDVEVIVLDDAFQHRWIHRDLDILVFDNSFLLKAGGMDQNLLPVGLMREPFSAIRRADAVIINRKFSSIGFLPPQLRGYFDKKKIFNAFYRAAGLFDVKSHSFYDVQDFRGQKSLVISGIANPQSFLNILRQSNIDTENQLIFKDHKDYTLKDVQSIRKAFYSTNSHSVITTQKDAVKLSRFSKELDDIDIYYLKIEMDIENRAEFEEFLLNKIEV
ncbi:MAG: tetraacyldisaccharide 4'-kinase [Ignavibacteria bacterium]|jgi:tetraacyldisaccharide 4'-kinase|nr:tetraacyldisaccharide 4'-kinase [Ignavibacteria bacterium]MCU7502759.1 tetraacyldisaccharide 4'-kinase [Ignavibacteria bacterium]MCU7518205.1 tetraacyldisaccharide 4'-kinase [Ignavibacteria bacterium]